MVTRYEERRLERIREELVGKPTGFDILVKRKKENIWKVYYLIKENPDLTRKELSDQLGISMRTTTRYLAVAKKLFRKGLFISQADKQTRDMKKRLTKMKQIVARKPDIPNDELCKKLGVSKQTLYKYFALVHKA